MDMKRLMTGAVVGGLTLFAMGYLAYEVLLVDFFDANATGDAGREALIFPAIIAGEILMGALLTMTCDWSGSTGRPHARPVPSCTPARNRPGGHPRPSPQAPSGP